MSYLQLHKDIGDKFISVREAEIQVLWRQSKTNKQTKLTVKREIYLQVKKSLVKLLLCLVRAFVRISQ